jgi:hypothetical protein
MVGVVGTVLGVMCWLILRDVLYQRDEDAMMGADNDDDSHIVEVADDEVVDRDNRQYHGIETNACEEDANSIASWHRSSRDEGVSVKKMRNIDGELVADSEESLSGGVDLGIIAEMYSESISLSEDSSNRDYSDDSSFSYLQL